MSDKSILDSFVVLKTIKNGEHAVVKLVQDNSGNKYAAKVYKARSAAMRSLQLSLWETELKAYRNIENNRTLRVHASSSSGLYKKKHSKGEYTCYYLLFEYCPFGSFWDIVKLAPTEKIIRYLLKQILEALDRIHENNLGHLNVKLENILIDENFNVKICGFSHSSFNTVLSFPNRIDYYKPPEILKRKGYDKENADLWAVGVLVFILACQKPPFMRADMTDPHYKLFQIRNNDYWTRMKPKNKSLSAEFQKFINYMLAEEPSLRLSIVKIRKHGWYNLEDPNSQELHDFFAKVREKSKNL